jgi:uncharacterized membrane protein
MRGQILDWAAEGRLTGDPRAAIAAAGAATDAADWRALLDRLLLAGGVLLLASGLIFFIAYNWQAIGRMGKFALVEGVLLGCLVGCWRFGVDSRPGKAMLAAAALVTGGLLALIGQTYQTGADTWELFAAWAALVLPLALVARMAPLWLLLVGLLDLAVVLWMQAFPGVISWLFRGVSMFWTLFALNAVALALWEFARTRLAWLRERWPPRLLALAAGALATGAAIAAIIDPRTQRALHLLAYAAWLGVLYAVYRHRIRDLFMLAGGALSVIVVVAVALAKLLIVEAGADGAAFFLVAIAVIAMSAAAAAWLRRLAAEGVR